MSELVNLLTPELILNAALLRAITHAVWAINNPELAYEYSWDGINYVIRDSMGQYGAITFKSPKVVGAFFDVHSSRNPLKGKAEYNISKLFEGASKDILELANKEALQYLLKKYKGLKQPIITAAFWADNGNIVAAESWKNVVKHGAHIIAKDIFTNYQNALKDLQVDYKLSDTQISLVRDLFNQKISQPDTEILLNHDQVQVLIKKGTAGENETRELLKTIGIVWP